MKLISVSDYRKNCSKYLREALKNPSMSFKGSLDHLDSIVLGYQLAYIQLGVISREQGFCYSFMDWLYDTKQISANGGWGYAIESIAEERGVDRYGLLAELLDEFLPIWSQEEE